MYFLLLLLLLSFSQAIDRQLPVVVITTHAREGEDWLQQSLASLLLASEGHTQFPEIHLMVGGLDTHYLDNLKHHNNLYVHPLSHTDEAWWNNNKGTTAWRGGYNYVRCLNISRTDTRDILIAEDDVIYANDLWIKLEALRDEIEVDHEGDYYMIDAYHRFSNRGKPDAPGKHYRTYRFHFCCTQLMFFTHKAAVVVADYIQHDLFEKPELGYDISLAHAATHKQIPLYGALPALAQHIGSRSSIGSTFHITEQFDSKLQYNKRTNKIRYGRERTEQLLTERSHITEQLRRHSHLN